ncbi:MAG: T9SS type A sorting domain-containing protein [Flavobacteriales bacterium]|nr:T9SS type A sorting domain-containing protein [Flavobacteriales bacterium]
MTNANAQKRYLIAAALFAGAAAICAQVPWQLDPTFRTQINTENVNSLALLPNGQILISGRINYTNSPLDDNWSTMRLNADGSRDDSFPPWPLSAGGGGKIVPWNDKFYIRSVSMVRALNNGLRDAQFTMANDQFFDVLQLEDFFVYPDGSLVIVGGFDLHYPDHDGVYNMVWVTNTGAIDLSRPPRKGNGDVTMIQPQTDGKFILSGGITYWEGEPTGNTFRVDADGTLDPTFQAAITWGLVLSATVLDDGRILASGLFKTEFSSPDSLHFVRLMPNGSLDPTFNNDMEVVQPPWGPPLWPNMPISWGQFTFVRHKRLPDGRIVLFGQYQTIDGHLKRGLGLLDEDGYWLEDPFGSAGCGEYAYSGGTGAIDFIYNNVVGLLEAPDGYIFIWGAYKGYDDGTTNDPTQAFVSRLYGLNVGVREHEQLRMRVYPNPASATTTMELEQVPHGAVVLLRDALGREVLRQRVSDHYTTLQLQTLADGIYSMQLVVGDTLMANPKIVVQH